MREKFLERDTATHLQTLEADWKKLLKTLNARFDADLDLESVLFLIGIQELGQGYKKYTKDQKLELMHIAICTLLVPYGYYIYKGRDDDGYPHWETNDLLPPLNAGQQMALMKSCILGYFGEEYFTDQS
jgi:hypothetical protein